MAWWWPFEQSRAVKAETINGNVYQGVVNNYAAPSDAPVVPRIAWAREALHPDTSPLAWLTWNARLTDLIGRDSEKADLLHWARSGGGVSVRFLVGEGGTGKTRLAHEVAEELAQAPGWAAGLVPADRPLPLDAGHAGCLLLIDYPEEQRDALTARLRELATAAADPSRPVRVLLLSRRGPEVWDSVLLDTGAHLRAARPLPLAERLNPADAWAIFRSALARVPRPSDAAAPRAVTEAAFRAWLDRVPLNHRPLLIAAAAIQAVADPTRTVVDLTAAQVVDALAEREASRLRRLAKVHGFAPDALCRLAALAAVRGGLGGQLLRRLAAPDLYLGLGGDGDLLDRLEAAGLIVDGRLPAPQPDIAAAALTVNILAARPDDAPKWLWAVVEEAPIETLARLERLTYDSEVILSRNRTYIAEWLCRAVDAEPGRCLTVNEFAASTVSEGLVAFSCFVNKRLFEGSSDQESKAKYAIRVSVDLGAQQENQEALRYAKNANEIMIRATGNGLFGNLNRLAGTYNNLSIRLGAVGHLEDALDAIKCAVEIRIELARCGDIELQEDLARSLSNMSVRLIKLKKISDAVDASRESCRIRRKIYAERMRDGIENNSALEKIRLSISLANLAHALSEFGSSDEAMTIINESIELRRSALSLSPILYSARYAQGLAIRARINLRNCSTRGEHGPTG